MAYDYFFIQQCSGYTNFTRAPNGWNGSPYIVYIKLHVWGSHHNANSYASVWDVIPSVPICTINGGGFYDITEYCRKTIPGTYCYILDSGGTAGYRGCARIEVRSFYNNTIHNLSGNVDCVSDISLYYNNSGSCELIDTQSVVSPAPYSYQILNGCEYKIKFDDYEKIFTCTGDTIINRKCPCGACPPRFTSGLSHRSFH